MKEDIGSQIQCTPSILPRQRLTNQAWRDQTYDLAEPLETLVISHSFSDSECFSFRKQH